MAQYRPDKHGTHRAAYEKNKRYIVKTQDTCGICGRPVDKKLKYPDPMSPVVDHIIPIAKGGHPSDLNNLQLCHNTCNRQKSDKLFSNEKNINNKNKNEKTLGNRNLPQSRDWKTYRSE